MTFPPGTKPCQICGYEQGYRDGMLTGDYLCYRCANVYLIPRFIAAMGGPVRMVSIPIKVEEISEREAQALTERQFLARGRIRGVN